LVNRVITQFKKQWIIEPYKLALSKKAYFSFKVFLEPYIVSFLPRLQQRLALLCPVKNAYKTALYLTFNAVNPT